MNGNIVPVRYFQRKQITTVAVIASLFVQCASLIPSRIEAKERNTRARAARLVEQLGHEQFAMREQAAAGLIGLQIDSEAALRAGLSSENREIRYRCGKLLGVVLDLDLQNRFELFKESTDPEQDYGLPGWEAYREVAGDDPMARSIFVSMHQDESKLLEMSTKTAKQLNRALLNHCHKLTRTSMFGRLDVGIGTTATLLFLAARDGVELNAVTANSISMACRSGSFISAMESPAARNVLLRMAEKWIVRQPIEGMMYALHFGLAYDLKSVLPRARQVLVTPRATVMDRLYACRCLAKHGDKTDIDLLEKSCLDDVTVFGQVQVEGKFVTNQMRDVGLASLVLISGQQPADFGFDRFMPDRHLAFDVESLGFRDEQSRAAAINKWLEYQARSNDAE